LQGTLRLCADFALIDICGDVANDGNSKLIYQVLSAVPSISEPLVLLLVHPSDDSRFER